MREVGCRSVSRTITLRFLCGHTKGTPACSPLMISPTRGQRRSRFTSGSSRGFRALRGTAPRSLCFRRQRGKVSWFTLRSYKQTSRWNCPESSRRRTRTRLTSRCNRPPASRAAAERPIRYTDLPGGRGSLAPDTWRQPFTCAFLPVPAGTGEIQSCAAGHQHPLEISAALGSPYNKPLQPTSFVGG
jgi:hypothetical protein